MINVNIPAAQMGECKEFRTYMGEAGTPHTVVITPLRITFITDDVYKISFGCNYWKSCKHLDCSYCAAGMDRGNQA